MPRPRSRCLARKDVAPRGGVKYGTLDTRRHWSRGGGVVHHRLRHQGRPGALRRREVASAQRAQAPPAAALGHHCEAQLGDHPAQRVAEDGRRGAASAASRVVAVGSRGSRLSSACQSVPCRSSSVCRIVGESVSCVVRISPVWAGGGKRRRGDSLSLGTSRAVGLALASAGHVVDLALASALAGGHAGHAQAPRGAEPT